MICDDKISTTPPPLPEYTGETAGGFSRVCCGRMEIPLHFLVEHLMSRRDGGLFLVDESAKFLFAPSFNVNFPIMCVPDAKPTIYCKIISSV